MNRSDQSRIDQLTSPYSPFEPPQLPLDFSDYLSLLWRIDWHASQPHLVRYYTECARALSRAFQFEQRSLGRLIRTTEPGQVYLALSNAPFRNTDKLSDAAARKAAIRQLAALRSDVLAVGSYQHEWLVGWPGSNIIDEELREHVFAILFTALPSQYTHFGRLLLVIDYVLQELLLGTRDMSEFSLDTLIECYGYPNPASDTVHELYRSDIGI